MKELINGNTIRKAENSISSGEAITIKDTLSPGLEIRIKNKTGSWYYSTRNRNLKISALAAFRSDKLGFLRSLVARARAIEADGRNPGDLIKEAVLAETVEEAEARAEVKTEAAWTWENLRHHYLEFVKANRTASTFIAYRSNLAASPSAMPKSELRNDLAPLAGKPAKAITPQDILEVRNNMLERGKLPSGEYSGNIRQANHTVTILRSCFKFGIEQYKKSGIVTNPAAGVPVFALTKKQKKHVVTAVNGKRRPISQLELGGIIGFLETWPNHSMRLAFMLQMMTGQRIESIISVLKKEFVKAPVGSDYEYVWEIDSDKSGSARSLPLPDFASTAIENAMRMSRADNEFLFPQLRPRRSGDTMAGHMSKRGANEIWHAMRGEDGPLGQCGWKVAGHDLRRAFVSHMKSEAELHGFKDDDTDLITHADEGAETTAEKFYDLDKHMRQKWRVIKAWNDFVAQGYEYAVQGLDEETAMKLYNEKRSIRAAELGVLD